jgi:hypothetical protein
MMGRQSAGPDLYAVRALAPRHTAATSSPARNLVQAAASPQQLAGPLYCYLPTSAVPTSSTCASTRYSAVSGYTGHFLAGMAYLLRQVARQQFISRVCSMIQICQSKLKWRRASREEPAHVG